VGSIVTVRITLNQDGSLFGDPVVVNHGGSPSQTAAASALRAIRLCQPFRLPVTKYHLWQVIEITLDPHPAP
jgi:colicin import membrane protein